MVVLNLACDWLVCCFLPSPCTFDFVAYLELSLCTMLIAVTPKKQQQSLYISNRFFDFARKLFVSEVEIKTHDINSVLDSWNLGP